MDQQERELYGYGYRKRLGGCAQHLLHKLDRYANDAAMRRGLIGTDRSDFRDAFYAGIDWDGVG